MWSDIELAKEMPWPLTGVELVGAREVVSHRWALPYTQRSAPYKFAKQWRSTTLLLLAVGRSPLLVAKSCQQIIFVIMDWSICAGHGRLTPRQRRNWHGSCHCISQCRIEDRNLKRSRNSVRQVSSSQRKTLSTAKTVGRVFFFGTLAMASKHDFDDESFGLRKASNSGRSFNRRLRTAVFVYHEATT